MPILGLKLNIIGANILYQAWILCQLLGSPAKCTAQTSVQN